MTDSSDSRKASRGSEGARSSWSSPVARSVPSPTSAARRKTLAGAVLRAIGGSGQRLERTRRSAASGRPSRSAACAGDHAPSQKVKLATVPLSWNGANVKRTKMRCGYWGLVQRICGRFESRRA